MYTTVAELHPSPVAWGVAGRAEEPRHAPSVAASGDVAGRAPYLRESACKKETVCE